MTTPVILDIETEALPPTEVTAFRPEFTAPSNYKDPEKIEQYIRDQQARWLADGTLSALTARVLCIGTRIGTATNIYTNDDEGQMLEDFWLDFDRWARAGCSIIGHCIRRFDLPFLVRRSWARNVSEPETVYQGHHLSFQILDTSERWGFGGHEPRDRISLDHLAQHLRIGAKTGSGAEFATLWRRDRAMAEAYLNNDLILTQRAAVRLFKIPPP